MRHFAQKPGCLTGVATLFLLVTSVFVIFAPLLDCSSILITSNLSLFWLEL